MYIYNLYIYIMSIFGCAKGGGDDSCQPWINQPWLMRASPNSDVICYENGIPQLQPPRGELSSRVNIYQAGEQSGIVAHRPLPHPSP